MLAARSRARVLDFALFFRNLFNAASESCRIRAGVTQETGCAQAEQLTTALMTLNTQYQSAGPESNAERLSELGALAAQRQQLLSSLMGVPVKRHF
jgi:hypothetical protein